MWELVIDLFWPSRGMKSIDALAEKITAGGIRVEWGLPGAFKRALNESGWLDEEVIAAGLVTQGKTQSLFRMMTGLALLEVLHPRRCKSLPKEFTLAVTGNRIIAFKMNPWKEGTEDSVTAVKVKNEQLGSWSRGGVRVTDASSGRVQNGGTLDFIGTEQFPFTWSGDDSTNELIELLSR
jgi:hypothetical protein